VPGTKRLQDKLCRACFGRGPDRRPRELNDLEGTEWAEASRSVEQYPDIRTPSQRIHGASFPLSLARQQVQIYTKRGATVLDPFVGVGTTLVACAELGRLGMGVDLNKEFIELAREDLARQSGGHLQRLVTADARQVQRYLLPDSVDFLLTSPPYGSLLKGVGRAFPYKWKEHSKIDAISNPRPYSNRPEDLGNLDYSDFLDALFDCLLATHVVMKPQSYAVWVVKDFRALKDKVPYVNFHGHFIERAEAAGYKLWDIRIYDQTRYRPLVCLGFPSRNFYLNIGHSYLIILRKM
jgi:DNA modification methylase